MGQRQKGFVLPLCLGNKHIVTSVTMCNDGAKHLIVEGVGIEEVIESFRLLRKDNQDVISVLALEYSRAAYDFRNLPSTLDSTLTDTPSNIISRIYTVSDNRCSTLVHYADNCQAAIMGFTPIVYFLFGTETWRDELRGNPDRHRLCKIFETAENTNIHLVFCTLTRGRLLAKDDAFTSLLKEYCTIVN